MNMIGNTFSNFALNQQQQLEQQHYEEQLNQLQNTYRNMVAQEQEMMCQQMLGYKKNVDFGFGWESGRSRAASPTSVLTHDVRGSFNLQNTANNQAQVLMPQGIPEISAEPQKLSEDLNEVLSSLLGVYQQNEQSYMLQQPAITSLSSSSSAAASSQVPMLSGFNAEGVAQPAVTQQVDLMQQILTSPFGNPLYKTELCRAYDETKCCRFGDRCKYAHGKAELKPAIRCSNYKTKICKTFVDQGQCPYGSRCNFIHSPQKTTQEGEESDDLSGGQISERSSNLSISSSVSSPRRLPVFVWLTQMGSQEDQY
eukprot:TRINITY_DN10580_c0_g1_i1.p1 TRINITY_DN10580_c0_g1~~TRINITY_DN10580_c0_g1_i1.p1  ORF type:complete len:311 (-),score=42.37 TRINITY_DN10580_c0_g1_i1:533-1465(-)